MQNDECKMQNDCVAFGDYFESFSQTAPAGAFRSATAQRAALGAEMRWLPAGQTEGLSLSIHHNPPVSSADSPLYTRGPFPVPTIILQITLLVSVKGRRLYRPKEKLLCIDRGVFYVVLF